MIHPKAIVNENAQVLDSTEIGPYAIIDEHVTLGVQLPHHVVNQQDRW